MEFWGTSTQPSAQLSQGNCDLLNSQSDACVVTLVTIVFCFVFLNSHQRMGITDSEEQGGGFMINNIKVFLVAIPTLMDPRT